MKTNRPSTFKRELRQFRLLTMIGYGLLTLIVAGMVVASAMLHRVDAKIPTALPIALVGFVLIVAVAMPFLLAAYDKTVCPHCGKRIEDGTWLWHGIKCNGPTRRYWKLFFGRPLRCPHCQAEVIAKRT